MGMGFSAAKCVAIKYDDLKQMCPSEIAAIEQHPKFKTWGELAHALWVEDSEELTELDDLVVQLQTSFNKATAVNNKGLELMLTFYDEESGDRYDKVEHLGGCIFELDGVHKLTPAANKLKKKLQFGSYVIYC